MVSDLKKGEKSWLGIFSLDWGTQISVKICILQACYFETTNMLKMIFYTLKICIITVENRDMDT